MFVDLSGGGITANRERLEIVRVLPSRWERVDGSALDVPAE
jgi:hypothetical protein